VHGRTTTNGRDQRHSRPTHTNLPRDFSERLRRLRAERGLTAQELSVAAGIAVEDVYDLENDQRTPSMRVVHRLADALGVPRENLIATPSDDDLLAAFVALIQQITPALEAFPNGHDLRHILVAVRYELEIHRQPLIQSLVRQLPHLDADAQQCILRIIEQHPLIQRRRSDDNR
jgi:transcriptional regulator with XRE-family HTH domain